MEGQAGLKIYVNDEEVTDEKISITDMNLE